MLRLKKQLKYYACIVFLYLKNQTIKQTKTNQMKDKTIDYALRATWQAVARMYNEEVTKYGATMATGFALLSIDKENGSSTSSRPQNGNKLQV